MQPLLQIDRLSIESTPAPRRCARSTTCRFRSSRGRRSPLVGESGCGKSVTAMSVLRLLPQPPARYTHGRVLFEGRDLLTLTEKQMRRVRGREIADDLPGADDQP